MNDRLGDTADGRDLDPEAGPSSSSAPGIPAAPGQGRTQFIQDVNDVTISTADIHTRLLLLQKSSDDYWEVTRATDLKVIKKKMGEVLDETCVIAGELWEKLEALDRSNAANRNIMNIQAGSSTDRARTSITSNLRKRLRELAVDFQGLGQSFQEDQQDIVEMRLFSVTGQNVHESVIKRLLETRVSDPIFRNAILAQGRGEVLGTIAEIRERRDAVKVIEKKLLELHQIFHVMTRGILVEAELGELDDINLEAEVDLPVDNAFDHVSKCLIFSIILLIVGVNILVVTTM